MLNRLGRKGMSNLSELQRAVCREGKTEPPFQNAYWNHKEKGFYDCVCCDLRLFSSEHKFDSGTGWPSFFQSLTRLKEITDLSLGIKRVEVKCSQCDAHLGHVFDDGPAPTGLRYCINSASLRFKNQ